MKKNKLAAIIVGAVLITGSTVSISAASIGKAHHKSHSSKGSQNSAFLRGVASGDSWAALHSVLNPNEKKDSPVAPILAPSGILPSDTSTVTISSDENGINEEHGTNHENASGNNEAAELNDDDAVIGIPVVSSPTPTPSATPNIPAAIANPMTNSRGDSHENSDHSQSDSND